MPHYRIDVWQDESIWSWGGKVDTQAEAFEEARLTLNDDWDETYATWDDLAADMDGTALLYDTDKDDLDACKAALQLAERALVGAYGEPEEGASMQSQLGVQAINEVRGALGKVGE